MLTFLYDFCIMTVGKEKTGDTRKAFGSKSLQGDNFLGFAKQEYVTGKCPAGPAL
jgi:hypothetical protein